MSENLRRVLTVPGTELVDQAPQHNDVWASRKGQANPLYGLSRRFTKITPVAGIKSAPQSQEIAIRKGMSAPQLSEINRLLMSIVSSSRYLHDASRSRYYVPPLSSSMMLRQRKPRPLYEPNKPLDAQQHHMAWKRGVAQASLRHSDHLRDVARKARSQTRHVEAIRMNKLEIDQCRLSRCQERVVRHDALRSPTKRRYSS